MKTIDELKKRAAVGLEYDREILEEIERLQVDLSNVTIGYEFLSDQAARLAMDAANLRRQRDTLQGALRECRDNSERVRRLHPVDSRVALDIAGIISDIAHRALLDYET